MATATQSPPSFDPSCGPSADLADAAHWTAGAKAVHWLTVQVTTGGFALPFVMVESPIGILKISLYKRHKAQDSGPDRVCGCRSADLRTARASARASCCQAWDVCLWILPSADTNSPPGRNSLGEIPTLIVSSRVIGRCLALVSALELSAMATKAKADEVYVDERFGGHPAIGTVLVGPPEVVPQWASLAEDLRLQLEDPPPSLAGVRAFVASDGQADARRLVRAIRDYVTGRIEYVTDRPRDRWASPRETMAGGVGDCEDQAILGLYIALAAGVPPERAAVAIGRDRRGRQHAILFVGDGDGRAFAFNIAEPGAVPLARSGFRPEVLGFFDAVGVPRPVGAVRSLPGVR